MKRFLLAVLTISITCGTAAMAQHGGHGGGTSGRPAGSTGTTGDSDAAGGLKSAIAVQATPEQAAEFRSMLQVSTAALAVVREAEPKLATGTYAKDSAVLGSGVKQARQSNALFLDSLSNAQDAGLKKPIKSLRKADASVGSSWETLARQLSSPKAANSKMEDAVQKLENALDKLHSGQVSLGAEMGVQMPKLATPSEAQPAPTIKPDENNASTLNLGRAR
jgi:hypothetical protein